MKRERMWNKKGKGDFMGEVIVSPEYSEWIKSISLNFKQCQIKAASKVNEEMLLFYWKIGKDISKMNKMALYGSDFIVKSVKILERNCRM